MEQIYVTIEIFLCVYITISCTDMTNITNAWTGILKSSRQVYPPTRTKQTPPESRALEIETQRGVQRKPTKKSGQFRYPRASQNIHHVIVTGNHLRRVLRKPAPAFSACSRKVMIVGMLSTGNLGSINEALLPGSNCVDSIRHIRES